MRYYFLPTLEEELRIIYHNKKTYIDYFKRGTGSPFLIPFPSVAKRLF